MALPTISVRKAADIPRSWIDASSARTHFSLPGASASVPERFGASSFFNDDILGPSMDTADLKIFGDGAAHALIVLVPLKDYGQPRTAAASLPAARFS